MHVELESRGTVVGRHQVALIRLTTGLGGVCRREGWRTTVRDPRPRPAPDLLDREFSACEPNQLRVAHVTHVPTWTGFVFLPVVLDAFSRWTVGWAMATHLRTELVSDALNMALSQRRSEQVNHHSDQGLQYTSIGFGERYHDRQPTTQTLADHSRLRNTDSLLRQPSTP